MKNGSLRNLYDHDVAHDSWGHHTIIFTSSDQGHWSGN